MGQPHGERMEPQTEYTKRPIGGTVLLALFFTVVLVAMAGVRVNMEEPPGLVLFLGRFHPLAVHLPIGFIIALFLLEIVDLSVKSMKLHHATFVVAWLAAVSSVLSAAAGVLLSYGGEYGAELLARHLWTGTATGVLALWMLVLKMRCGWQEKGRFSPAYHGIVFLTTAMLATAGHYGGAITHGSDYLTAHMPDKLRMILGGRPAETAKPAADVLDPGDAPVYATVIEPILQDKCVNCHGAEKQEHRLRLDSHAAVLQGGKSGSNVVAGSSSDSLLVRSMRLPLEDKLHMPPKGKPQPAPDDIALLAWWIDQGAPETTPLRNLKMSRVVARILNDRVGLPAAGDAAPPMQKQEAILPLAAKIGEELGLPVMPVSAKDDGLQFAYIIGSKKIGDEEVARLLPLSSNLVRLDLGGSEVTDAGLAHIGRFSHLRRLDLHGTAVTDAGVTNLAGLQRLEYLNLYGTKITDAALEPLKQLAALRNVYLWQTAVTPAAAEAFARSFVDEGQQAAWKREMAELQARIDAMGVRADLGTMPEPAPATNAAAPAASAQAGAAKPFNATCCFTGKPVDPQFSSAYKGKVIGFCCDKCKARFDKDPDGEARKIPPLAKL